MRECFTCKHKYPLFLFPTVKQGWFREGQPMHSCRMCRLKKPIRYKRGDVDKRGFASLKPYEVSIIYRLKEFIE